MASNGGTLHGVPQSVTEQQQQQQQQHICSQCGLYFESVSSLQVHHMHYHQHDSMNRWDTTQQAVVSTTIATTAVATTTTAATITTNGAPIPSSTTPTSSDTENNNHQSADTGLKPILSPQHTTIAAAADSSDNQPPTPQPLTDPGTPGSYGGAGNSGGGGGTGGGASPYQTQLGAAPVSGGGEMHYPTYIHPGYDPGSYYASGTGLDYGGGVLGASSLQPADYKSGSSVVSSARYHPYGASSSSSNSSGNASATNGTSDGSAPAVVTSNGAGVSAAGLSPHVVSSSNGVTAVGSGSTATVTTVASTTSAGSGSQSHSPPNGSQQQQHIPPTPSPSPIQCDKCGLVCESDEALNQHESTVHSGSSGSADGVSQTQQQQQQQQDRQQEQEMQSASGNCYGGPPYGGNGPATPQFIKEEAPASDILDLDSQKMVYTPTADGGLLPPMNSLHPLQSMQRHHPMMWPHHDPHNFMGPPAPLPPHPSSHVVGGTEMKHSAAAAAAAAAAYYHHPIKSEYSATPSIKSDYHLGGGGGGGQYLGAGGPGLVKNEYSLAPTLAPPVAIAPQPTNPQSMKQYADEMHDNQLATSPSDFPSTTTPQESGSQYRTFEPATSSLPGPGPGPTKGTAWKSNEARRPKTYNCTACNKWFTSSGHLKRHYNTTLHKNAVKSSGQPDPATLPISVHHHPGRDPNYANKGRRGTGTGGAGGNGSGPGAGGPGSQIQQPIQQPVPPPDPPRSPEYGSAPGAGQHSQYSSMSGGQSGFPAVIGTPPHGGHQVVVSSNQSPGFHHAPYANGTASSSNNSSNSASSTSSSTVPPNGVAGPSVQVSQPRGLQIYSNSSSSSSTVPVMVAAGAATTAATPPAEASSLEPMEPATHTITTILTPITLQQPTTYTGMAITPGTTSASESGSGATTDCTSTRTDTTGTRTPPTMGQQQQQPPPQQPLPPHTTISSMEPYHHPHHHHPTMQPMHHTICSPLTISTSIPSFQTILPEAPSYHPTIGNSHAATVYQLYQPLEGVLQPLPPPSSTTLLQGDQQQQQQQDGQQQQQWMSTDGTLMESSTLVGSLGFPRCSGGAEMYQGDTAPPFSPNVPDQYQRPSSQGHDHHHQQHHNHHHQLTTSTTDDHKYTDYQLQQQQQQQQYQLQRVGTPQHAATAPSISPAPCSPSVTSTAGGGGAGGRPSTAPPSDGATVEIFRCDECDKVFNKSCYLTQHNKTFHCGDKPYKCHRCGKRFGCNATYEEHLAKHGGEKPFKCELCPKQFNHKTDLRRHMCLHSGSKPYACERCGKGFIRKDHMLKHAETHRRASMVSGQRRGSGMAAGTTKHGGATLKGGGKAAGLGDQRESVDGMATTAAAIGGIIGMDE